MVHTHQVLQHLTDPRGSPTGEMRRACRPGVSGEAARDGDYGGMLPYPEDPELDEWRDLYRKVARAVGGEPDAGRRMLSWARRGGLAGDRGVGERVVLHRAARSARGGERRGPSG